MAIIAGNFELAEVIKTHKDSDVGEFCPPRTVSLWGMLGARQVQRSVGASPRSSHALSLFLQFSLVAVLRSTSGLFRVDTGSGQGQGRDEGRAVGGGWCWGQGPTQFEEGLTFGSSSFSR